MYVFWPFFCAPTANFTFASRHGCGTLTCGGFERLRIWAEVRCRVVVSTGSTTVYLGRGALPRGGFDRLNHRVFGRRHVAVWWFRQAQPPCIWAEVRCRVVVSTGSTTAAGRWALPRGGFDRARAWRRHVAAWWFRQAQPPCIWAEARCRVVVSTGRAHGRGTLPRGGFDRLNHRVFGRWHVAVWWFRQAQPPRLGGGALPFGGFDRARAWRRHVAAWWFRQAQPPCIWAEARCRVVVSTGSTTVYLGGGALPCGGFDRARTWLRHVAAWWFRQAQPPCIWAEERCCVVVSTGSTTAAGRASKRRGRG
jgi:hypothetical protein